MTSDYIEIVDKLKTILLCKETIKDVNTLNMSIDNLSLSVWTQDFTNLLEKLQEIVKEMEDNLRKNCNHEWVEDYFEANLGECLHRVTFCKKCELIN